MRCEDLVALIIDYLEGEMDPLLREEFQRHMGDCSSCLAFLETYKKTKELTKDIKCDDIPDEVKRRVREFLKKQISKS